jgi:hypothetical protein
VGLGDRSRWRGKKASSWQVTYCTRAGLDVSERVVVHVAASWEVGSAALLFVISRTARLKRGCLVGCGGTTVFVSIPVSTDSLSSAMFLYFVS